MQSHRRLFTMIRCVAVLMCIGPIAVVGLAFKAVREFKDPFPLWMADAPQWYDSALAAVMYGIVFVACISYLRRIARDGKPPSRWPQKTELRIVLYCLAGLLVLQFPLALQQAIRAMHTDLPSWDHSFFSVFPTWGWLGPPIGIAIVYFDRRRVVRGSWVHSGACLACGYNLTGNTSGICPECGIATGKS